MARVEVADYTAAGWERKADPDARARFYCRELEDGAILYFPAPPFPLPAEDAAFLRSVRQVGAAYHKNISYRPGLDRVKGFEKSGTDGLRLREVLRRYSQGSIRFAADFLRPYASRWQVDYASFRSIEEAGRQISMKARNDLLHTDAFPSRPVHGHRILRIFTNVNASVPRIWLTGPPFHKLAPRLAEEAGLGAAASRARSPLHGLARRLKRAARAAGLPLVDRSPYDEFMLRFHDYLKMSRAIQEDEPKERWEFPPGSTWLVFTDTVPHAVMSGQYALEQTLIVRRDAMVAPETAPAAVLEELSGAPLSG